MGAEGPRLPGGYSPSPVLLPQDFEERYVQTGPGRLSVGSTQRFLHGGLPASLHCNHSIQYEAARGPQPQLVQHLRASAISTAFDPEAQALRFQLTVALRAGEAATLGPTPTTTPARGPEHLAANSPPSPGQAWGLRELTSWTGHLL